MNRAALIVDQHRPFKNCRPLAEVEGMTAQLEDHTTARATNVPTWMPLSRDTHAPGHVSARLDEGGELGKHCFCLAQDTAVQARIISDLRYTPEQHISGCINCSMPSYAMHSIYFQNTSATQIRRLEVHAIWFSASLSAETGEGVWLANSAKNSRASKKAASVSCGRTLRAVLTPRHPPTAMLIF